MLFALSTKNPPKTNALREALAECPYVLGEEVQIMGFKVASWVPDMPLNLSDIRAGAKNRVEEVRRLCPEANFFVGMEAGVYKDLIWDEWWLMGAVYIEDKTGEWHYAYTCHIAVPKVVIDGLQDGSGRRIDDILEAFWAPPKMSEGAGSFGLWSDMMLSRSDQFRLAVQCAISPFFNRYYTL